MKKLKSYWWQSHPDEEHGLAVVHYNIREAKSMAYSHWGSEIGFDDVEFTDQTIKWQKDVDLSKLKDKTPHVIDDYKEGLILGMYSFIEGENDCDKCGMCMDYVSQENVINDEIICDDCLEKGDSNE